MELLLLCACVALAFANGSNDNVKAVATLHGASAMSYRRAISLATVSQLLGSIASVTLAVALVNAFSGKGLVPPDLLSPTLLASAALAAALAVGAASVFGMPISTTHAIVGGVVGAGAVIAGSALDVAALGAAFAVPLALGPLLGIVLAWSLDRGGSAAGRRLGIDATDCICIDGDLEATSAMGGGAAAQAGLRVEVAPALECRAHASSEVAGIEVDRALGGAHVFSATIVAFARGLNDTPKIVGLMVGASAIEPLFGALIVGAAMAVGGLLGARRVAGTLAHRITPMENGSGLAANVATSLLVVGASRLGLPVSTTHVSTGGIFGIGAAGRTLHRAPTLEIVGAWVGTLPVAAGLAAALAWGLG